MSSNIQITKKCIYCKEKFIAKKVTTKYCSHRCNQIHYKKKQVKRKIEASKRKITIPQEERFWLSIPEAAALFNISERTLFRMMNKNEIMPLRIGRRVIIPKSELLK